MVQYSSVTFTGHLRGTAPPPRTGAAGSHGNCSHERADETNTADECNHSPAAKVSHAAYWLGPGGTTGPGAGAGAAVSIGGRALGTLTGGFRTA